MYFIAFYVPPEQAETVKQAMFAAGAGRIGNYACCSWQTEGMGQFLPLPAAQPFTGDIDTLTWVREYRIEMVCDDKHLQPVMEAFRKTHPYENPAFQVIRLEDC